MTDVDQIFNYPSHYLNKELSIQFRTPLSQTPVFGKKITGLGSSALLRLNCSLKITYNLKQTHLIVCISSIQSKEFMTFIIDLGLVKQRKMMFIKQEDGVSMLQVDCGQLKITEKEEQKHKIVKAKSMVDEFIAQKEKLISSMSWKLGPTARGRDSFSQNIYSLLQQTRQLRRCGVQKQQQLDNFSQQKKSEVFGGKSARQYMIGQYKLSLKDLRMMAIGSRSIRSDCSPDCKFYASKQQ